MNLWSIVSEVFRFPLPPTLLNRINFCNPSTLVSVVMVMLYNIYHTVKVGHRSLVDSAIAQCRFGKIHQLSFEVASMFKRRYLPNWLQCTELDDIASQLLLPVALSEDPDLVEIAPGVYAHRDSSILRDLNQSQISLSSTDSGGLPIMGLPSHGDVGIEVA